LAAIVHLAALLLPCYLTCFFLLLICFLDATKQPFWLASPFLASCFFELRSWAPTCNHHGRGPLLGVWDNILVYFIKAAGWLPKMSKVQCGWLLWSCFYTTMLLLGLWYLLPCI
jgi:hypothetical protein